LELAMSPKPFVRYILDIEDINVLRYWGRNKISFPIYKTRLARVRDLFKNGRCDIFLIAVSDDAIAEVAHS